MFCLFFFFYLYHNMKTLLSKFIVTFMLLNSAVFFGVFFPPQTSFYLICPQHLAQLLNPFWYSDSRVIPYLPCFPVTFLSTPSQPSLLALPQLPHSKYWRVPGVCHCYFSACSFNIIYTLISCIC